MKNIPRVFIDTDIKPHTQIPISRDVAHYLSHVMRTNECLVFGNGNEYFAQLSDDNKQIIVGNQTSHPDPSNNITLIFAPIKRTDDLLNMATQMGIARFQPVITERTTAHHINWDRMKKIVIQAAEQSNRNSVPEILQPIKFSDLTVSDLVFADERTAHGHIPEKKPNNTTTILVGPEGGFSDTEFTILDAGGAHGISLGKTILRAELAAAIAISKILE